ncbi:MAG: hypothetical protein ACREPT_04425, partial [Rudaea sp.]
MKLAHKYTFSCLRGLLAVFAVAALSLAATQVQAAATARPVAKKAAAKPKAPPAAAAIIWRGDRATERAFVADLAKQYQLSKLGKVTMQPFSTISGIDAVHDGSADVAGSARPA